MSSTKFDVLVSLVLSGEATEKQKIEFEEILNSSGEKQIVFEKLKRAWQVDIGNNSELYHQKKQDLWERFQEERYSGQWKTQNNFFWRVAAVLILAVVAGFSFYFLYKNKSANQLAQVTSVNEVIKETNPGEKLRTRLPDGTNVYLNAGSRLVYPEHFSDSNRLVQLIGEAYFDVAEDKARPFTVRTKIMDVTALGTVFDVNAYEKNTNYQVALVSGKLLIRNIVDQVTKIDSGQALTLSKVDYSFSKSGIDYLNQIAWTDGILNFDNNNFAEIVEVLELNYGVEFVLNRGLDPIRGTYTGSFKNENLDNLLKVLSFSMDFKYEMNGKKILIKNN